MIVFNGMDLIWLAIGAVFLIICGVILVIDRIAYAIKSVSKSALTKRSKRRASDGQMLRVQTL